MSRAVKPVRLARWGVRRRSPSPLQPTPDPCPPRLVVSGGSSGGGEFVVVSVVSVVIPLLGAVGPLTGERSGVVGVGELQAAAASSATNETATTVRLVRLLFIGAVCSVAWWGRDGENNNVTPGVDDSQYDGTFC